MSRAGADGPDGLLVVDKPAGPTSHDVVGRVRRLAGTRRVGHAGTLDPAATGVLVLGLGRATRLLTHLVGDSKDYLATVRLGLATVTDDAQGEPLGGADASLLPRERVLAAVAGLTGAIEQVPSAVSAVKVGGERAYHRVRAGESPELTARAVTVERFDVLAWRPVAPYLDLDVAVTVSSGTYVRALARDLGAALGVGGHLTALRRTRSGRFDLSAATPLDELELVTEPAGLPLLGLPEALATAFPVLTLADPTSTAVRHGRAVPAPDEVAGRSLSDGLLVGLLGPAGEALALARVDAGRLRPVVVLAPA